MPEEANDNAGDHQSESTTQETPRGGGSSLQRITSFMSANKIEAVLWMTRIFSMFSTISFFLPIFGGHPHSSYQKVLLSNAATSALRLHQRVPNFQFSRDYLKSLFLEDSAHYLFYSMIFVTSSPFSLALMPVFLYALLHAQNYTKQILNQIGPSSLQLIRNLLVKLESNQVNILRFIACSEIFLMPAIIFLLFSGQGSFLLPFMYYRFLSLRYSSRRNPYCRQLFAELRLVVETLCSKPQCPAFVKNICYKGIEIVCRLAPSPSN